MMVDTEVVEEEEEEVITENADHLHIIKTDHAMIDPVHGLILHVSYNKFNLVVIFFFLVPYPAIPCFLSFFC